MAYGMEIAAVIAAIVAAGMSYKNSTDAAARARRETNASLMRQRELQMQAEQEALKNANRFDVDDRKERQGRIEERLTEQYTAPVETAQSINRKTAATQGDVSGDYLTEKAMADADTLGKSRDFAKLFAKIGSAGDLRLQEGYGMADAAANIGRLRSFSQGQSAADAIRIREAGQLDPGLSLASNVLGALGSYGMSSGGSMGNLFGSTKDVIGIPASTYTGSATPQLGRGSGLGSIWDGISNTGKNMVYGKPDVIGIRPGVYW